MTKTVAKIVHKGTYRVVYDDSRHYNPYTIYKEWYDNGKHAKKLTAYADMTSCLYHIAEELNIR